MIDHHAALIYVMVMISAADRDMTDAELLKIGEIINFLPVFSSFKQDRLTDLAEQCATLLGEDDGLERALTEVRQALPAQLRETAYGLACEVAAADNEVNQEELRMLEMIRYRLDIDRLVAAAIERGARARFARL